MAGESILIIDDTPVNLKLTRILLVNEGYEVRTAPDAEQALAMLDSFRPVLMLVDIQLPGMDGLEFTRRVKANPRLKDIVVVALTAFAMKGDEQKATDAGCDGYITKPIDTRTLPVRVREYLDARKPPIGAVPPATPAPAISDPLPPSAGSTATPPPPAHAPIPNEPFGLAGPEVETLRRRFLAEGTQQSRNLLDQLGSGFEPVAAARLMHQWVGAAGLLGYREISSLARELEQLLQERPLDNAQARELLTSMVYAFSQPPEQLPRPVPASILESLGGRRVALVGFTNLDAERMCKALTRARALPRLFLATEPPDSEGVRSCDLVMIQAGAETLSSVWLSVKPPSVSGKPTVMVGDRETLLGLDHSVQERASEFLMDAWHPEEALMRASRALVASKLETAKPAAAMRFPPARPRPQVLLADDDSTVLSLVRATLLNYGMDVRAAGNGLEAMEQLRAQAPDVAILDVNMPGMDGFELLSRIRSESMPVRVILLTARQQEGDVVRGFNLGADDYMVKPFSPLELVARIKRLLHR